jgi:hypothetical protein
LYTPQSHFEIQVRDFVYVPQGKVFGELFENVLMNGKVDIFRDRNTNLGINQLKVFIVLEKFYLPGYRSQIYEWFEELARQVVDKTHPYPINGTVKFRQGISELTAVFNEAFAVESDWIDSAEQGYLTIRESQITTSYRWDGQQIV